MMPSLNTRRRCRQRHGFYAPLLIYNPGKYVATMSCFLLYTRPGKGRIRSVSMHRV